MGNRLFGKFRCMKVEIKHISEQKQNIRYRYYLMPLVPPSTTQHSSSIELTEIARVGTNLRYHPGIVYELLEERLPQNG